METWSWVVVAAAIAFFMPNTQEIVRRFSPALNFKLQPGEKNRRLARLLTWRPSRTWALGLGLLMTACLLSLNRPSEFIYFQF